jgi:ferredoxin, 2Fe-2S
MPKAVFIDPSGKTYVLEAALGQSLMQVALDHDVPGLLGECGGSCSCGTCHGYVDPAYADKLPPKSETELFMLEIVPVPRELSRLCCQIQMSAELDGIVIQLPDEQV